MRTTSVEADLPLAVLILPLKKPAMSIGCQGSGTHAICRDKLLEHIHIPSMIHQEAKKTNRKREDADCLVGVG